METIRAFVAIELSEEIKQALRGVQVKLKTMPGADRVRWVAPNNMHLTLKFLGEVPTVRVKELTGALEQVSTDWAPFTLTARALGCFPNTRRPNVVWVGLEGDLGQLTELAQQIETTYAQLGFPPEGRPFAPHLTLGRIPREVRPADRAELGTTIEKFPRADYGTLDVSTVYFIQSDLRPAGPIYTKLASVTLHRP